MVNPDGVHDIQDHYEKTGDIVYFKRKNNDREMERKLGKTCPDWGAGVDINRNYGYLWKGDDTRVCRDDYSGPHPFSEPETRAMRSTLQKYNDTIKFVYNFHAFGPMYVWPYNGLR